MTERPITPVRLTTLDGKEREFLLSMGGIRRIKKRLKVNTIAEVLSKDAEESGVPILYEALREKGGLTEDEFADVLPSNLESTVTTIARLLGASFPERDDRPTQASPPPPQIQ